MTGVSVNKKIGVWVLTCLIDCEYCFKILERSLNRWGSEFYMFACCRIGTILSNFISQNIIFTDPIWTGTGICCVITLKTGTAFSIFPIFFFVANVCTTSTGNGTTITIFLGSKNT